jgi:hypothetical protein
MVVHELDRVLDGDDVAEAVLVAIAEQRRHRGRLARAGTNDISFFAIRVMIVIDPSFSIDWMELISRFINTWPNLPGKPLTGTSS